MELQKALFEFFSSFGVPCYLDGFAGVETPFPYITFNLTDTPLAIPTLMPVRVWSKSPSFVEVLGIVDKIKLKINENSYKITMDNNKGYIVLNKGLPFFQYQPDDDPTQLLKIAYINIMITVYSI